MRPCWNTKILDFSPYASVKPTLSANMKARVLQTDVCLKGNMKARFVSKRAGISFWWSEGEHESEICIQTGKNLVLVKRHDDQTRHASVELKSKRKEKQFRPCPNLACNCIQVEMGLNRTWPSKTLLKLATWPLSECQTERPCSSPHYTWKSVGFACKLRWGKLHWRGKSPNMEGGLLYSTSCLQLLYNTIQHTTFY